MLSTDSQLSTAEHDLVAAHLNSQGAVLSYTIAPATLKLDVTYNLQLKLQNVAGFIGYQTHSIKSTLQLTPVITYTEISEHDSREALLLSIQPASPPSCIDGIPEERGVVEIEFITSWSQEPEDGDQVSNLQSFVLSHMDNQSLLFPAQTLQPDTSYTFIVTSTIQGSAGNPASEQVIVTTRKSELVPVIKGGDRSFSVQDHLYIDATDSYDSDTTESEQSLIFEWRCSMSSLANPEAIIDCKKSDNTPLTLPTNSPLLELPPQTLAHNNMYLFTLQLSKDDREAEKAISIKALDASSLLYASLELTAGGNRGQNFVNPHEELRFKAVALTRTPDQVTYQWTVPGLTPDAFDGPLDRREIKLRNWKVTPGSRFDISVTITDPEGASEAFTTIIVNDIPTGGDFSITPNTGVPVTTEFELSAGRSWADVHTVTAYQFSCYLKPEDVELPEKRKVLSPLASSPTFKTKLPKPANPDNTLILELRVFDGRGGYAVIREIVTLTPAEDNNVEKSLAIDLLSLNESSIQSIQILQSVQLLASVLLSEDANKASSTRSCLCENGDCSDPFNPSKCVCSNGYLGKFCTISEAEKQQKTQLRTQLLTSNIILPLTLH